MKQFAWVLSLLLFSSFQKLSGIKDTNWYFVQVTDEKSNRIVKDRLSAFSLYFSTAHILLKTSDEVLARYTFQQPGKLSVEWGDFPELKGDISEQQLKWYCKYRFSHLLYVIEGDTLKLQDVSGVNYTLVRR